jgi:hypothetical protein
MFFLLVGFQNCDRPYNLNLENPNQTSNSSASTKEVVINDGASLTNDAHLKFKLSSPYAQEVSITSDPECRGSWQAFAKQITKTWNEGDGVANLYVRFRNFRKEESECFSASITIDTTPPQVSLINPVNLVDSSHNPTFTVKAIDLISGLADQECLVKKKSEPMKSFSPCGGLVPLSGLDDDTYQFIVKAIDQAGNASEPFTFEWTVDSKVPGLKVTKFPSSFVASAQLRFEFSSDDPTDKFFCKIDSSAAVACISPWIVNSVANGAHQVSIVAKDSAANSAQFNSQFVVDTVLPTVTLESGPPVQDTSATAKIVFTTADTGSGVQSVLCKLDAELESPCSSSTSHTLQNLSSGPHTVTVVAVDRAGNRSGLTSLSWTVDLSGASLLVGLQGFWHFDEVSGTTAIDSIGGHNGTLVSLTTSPWLPSGRVKGALDFAGGNKNRVSIGNLFTFPGTQPFSVSGWVYRNAGGPAYQTMVSNSVADAAGRQGWTVSVCNSCSAGTPNRGFSCERYVNGVNHAAIDNTGPVPLNQWVHYACVYDGSKMKIYRDGVLAVTSSTKVWSMIDYPGTLMIGNNGIASSSGLMGRMDEVRVYNRTLTAAEALLLAHP